MFHDSSISKQKCWKMSWILDSEQANSYQAILQTQNQHRSLKLERQKIGRTMLVNIIDIRIRCISMQRVLGCINMQALKHVGQPQDYSKQLSSIFWSHVLAGRCQYFMSARKVPRGNQDLNPAPKVGGSANQPKKKITILYYIAQYSKFSLMSHP
jgi:hypothetical protein